MKTKFILIFIIGFGLVLNTCRKDGDGEMDEDEMTFEEAIQHEVLSEEEANFWKNLESTVLTTEEIMLPNGYTIKEFLEMVDQDYFKGDKKSALETNKLDPYNIKNKIIAIMGQEAIKLTTRSNFRYSGDGYAIPDQYGLAYSFGQRDHTVRQRPPVPGAGSNKGCAEELYGLDCSGFVYRLFLSAGLDLTIEVGERKIKQTWADLQRQPNHIMNAIKKAYPSYYDNLKVEDLGEKPISEWECGDIIYWQEMKEGRMNAYHIGMIFKDPQGVIKVAQSNGNGYTDCHLNYDIYHGPRFCELNTSILPSKPGFGDNYGIVRIGTKALSPPDVNHISVMVKIYGYYHDVAPTYTRDYEVDNVTIQCYNRYKGNFTENIFKASLDKASLNVKISGMLEAHFNSTYDTIKYLKWTETQNAVAWQNIKPFTRLSSCEIKNIPKSSTKGIFQVEGEKSCNHILSIVSKLTSNDGLNSTLTKHKCTWASKVYISISKE